MSYEENYYCKPDSELGKTPTARDFSQSPCSEFLAWSHAAGYSTCTSDIQLALWGAWRAGQKRTRELLVVWEMTIRNRNGITWNEMDAGDTLRLRKSIDELRAAIIPNAPHHQQPEVKP